MTDTKVIEGDAEELQPEDLEQFMPEPMELAVRDPSDQDELVWVMDRHDVEQVMLEVQHRALKVWVYEVPIDGKKQRELSYKGVRDIVGLMNRTGRVKIAALPETLKLERFKEDAGNGGPETFVRAVIFARDEVTGQMMPGVATEPLYMKLSDAKANYKRKDGKEIPADNRIFDPFAETKATNKAVRNALRTFIPEEAAQTVLAMFTGESNRVQRIRTEAEQKVAELPPPLDDDEAKALIGQAEQAYSEIRELGGGRGKVDFPPGRFAAWKLQAQHSHDRLRDLVTYMEGERDKLAAKYEGAAS